MINATVQYVSRSISSAMSSAGTVSATVEMASPASISAQVSQGVTGPPGEGDMESLIYDPAGRKANVYDAGNLTGNIDGGTFN